MCWSSASGDPADSDGLIEVEAGGTGFTHIKRVEPESGKLIAEDYHFCKLARGRGFSVYAAPRVRLSRAGTYVFERRFDPDWLKLSDGGGN
jgi:hypothetical protein